MANGKKKGHVLAVPLPVQGHVRPLMKLCRLISSRGVKVTFVNTEYVHRKILASDHQQNDDDDDNMVLTSIPDGLPPEDDRKDGVAMLASLKTTMAANLRDLIERINSSKSSDERISCVVADASVGWIFEVAGKMGIQVVGFLSSSAASFAIMHHSPTLIQQRILDLNGSITGSNTISLSDNIPSWRKNELAWSNPIDLKIQKYLFQWFLSIGKTSNQVKWLLCNTSYELEPSACDLIPNLLPIGPFTETNDSSSSFHHEDESCISWLNEKPHASVIYISFGSLSVMSQIQLNELAHGLEISGRPFLWVRSDLAYGSRVKYPDGFLERTLVVGKIVEWAPQERVLSHPSVACFVSHCGWNSILEGLSNAVPFLCWPYVIDQFHNQSYVCDKWRNGLRIEAGDYLVRTRDEIKTKIDMLFCDYDSLKANAVTLKTIAAKSTVDQGGSSSRNFQKFIDHLRARPLPKILSKF